MLQKRLVTTLCLLLATSVLLSSLHAAKVAGALVPVDDAKKTNHEASNSIAKVAPELHHHSDKSGSQFITDSGDHQNIYADTRSLRLLRDYKKDLVRYKSKVTDWLHSWWNSVGVHFS